MIVPPPISHTQQQLATDTIDRAESAPVNVPPIRIAYDLENMDGAVQS